MSLTCPVHGATAKMIPGGISKKTGAPYEAFWACSFKDCREKLQDSAAGPTSAPQAPRAQASPQAPARAPQTASGASENVLLLLGCLDFASRVYQGTGSEMDARAVAFAMYQQAKGEL